MLALTLSLPRMTERDLEEIAEAIEAYGRGIDSPDRDRFLYDKRLHLRLALGAGNPVLSNTLEQVLDRMIMKLRVEELPRERGPATLEEHRRILEALGRRDGEAAPLGTPGADETLHLEVPDRPPVDGQTARRA